MQRATCRPGSPGDIHIKLMARLHASLVGCMVLLTLQARLVAKICTDCAVTHFALKRFVLCRDSAVTTACWQGGAFAWGHVVREDA